MALLEKVYTKLRGCGSRESASVRSVNHLVGVMLKVVSEALLLLWLVAFAVPIAVLLLVAFVL